MMVSIKGNKPLRFFAMAMIVLLVVAHFMDQVDLTEVSFLWLMIAMALNAIQASFSGFCPMFKNARGECVACGVVCDSDKSQAKDLGCCSTPSGKASTGGNENCCSGDSKTSSGCCSGTQESKSSCCADQEALLIKVLGTGCASCNNTVKLIEEAAQHKGVCVAVAKVEDVAEIAAYGVLSTPAVVIHNQLVHSGSIPTPKQVDEWLDTSKSQ